MKREYRKPTIEIVDIETTEACLQAVSWHVSGKNTNSETDSGWVIEDQGEGKNGKDDPWDSTDW